MNDASVRRYELDHSAIVHLASMTEQWTNTFRLCATLDRRIDKELLQQALSFIAPRFPTIVDDQIEKVIFLDIDGVLNDSDNGPKIDETMVERLARIVNNTGAALILSSSWRWCYIRCMDADHPERNDDIEMLVELLDRHGMRIEGTTPIFFNGPYGRPFEVRTWLQRRARVKRFVILDDESFWQWNWLSDFFVCTEHQVGERKYECGLTEEDVQKAIAILNR